MTKPQMEIIFAPGCFDNFEGTQEELEAFMAEITNMLQSSDVEDRVLISNEFVATRHVYDEEEDAIDISASIEQMAQARKRILN